MESRKRIHRGPTPGRVVPATATASTSSLPHIAALIDIGGQITLGAMRPIKCVAIANADHGRLAMLQRRSDETLQQILERLDAAIEHAWTTDEFTDEINPPMPKATQRRRNLRQYVITRTLTAVAARDTLRCRAAASTRATE